MFILANITGIYSDIPTQYTQKKKAPNGGLSFY